MRRLSNIVCVAALASAACSEEFTPYNRLDTLRLLAIRAEPPSVAPGETTTLEALVHNHDGAPVEYAWSWCPWRGGTNEGYECALSASEFQSALEQAGVAGATINYDLGSEPTAQFAHLIDPNVLRLLCIPPDAANLPHNVPLPDCSEGFPLSIGLTVRSGTQEIRAFKQVTLLFDASRQANGNPTITGLRLGLSPTTLAQAMSVPEEPPAVAVERNKTYQLFAEVPEVAAETYVPAATEYDPEPSAQREFLAITWFTEGGETGSTRTSFLDGEIGFDLLIENTWETPLTELYRPESSAVYLVLRDDRGGVAWLRRQVALAAE